MCWMDQYLDVHGLFVVVVSYVCVCVCVCVCMRACVCVSCFFLLLKVGLGEYQRKILF